MFDSKKYLPLQDLAISRRMLLSPLNLILNTVVWSYMTVLMLTDMVSASQLNANETTVAWILYYFSMMAAVMIGGFSVAPSSRSRFLSIWLALTTMVTASFIFVTDFTWNLLLLLSAALGVSVGLGLPSAIAYLQDSTQVEVRGRVSGTILMAAYLVFSIFAVSAQHLHAGTNLVLFTIWRALGLILFLAIPRLRVERETRKAAPLRAILTDRNFTLYFAPWLMFLLVDTMEQPILESFYGGMTVLGAVSTVELAAGGIFTLVGGILLDTIGRKRTVMYAFVSLGLVYAVLALTPVQPFYLMLYSIVDGAVWGILTVTFMLTIWGDLSSRHDRERYSAVGIVPPSLAATIVFCVAPLLKLVPLSYAFSLACLFLFLAVVPLMYAPETLPERIVRTRELKDYIEKAIKTRARNR